MIEDDRDFLLESTDEALQEVGKSYFFAALQSILEDHNMEFETGLLKELIAHFSGKPLLGPLSLDEVRNVLLEYCAKTNEDGHLFVGGAIHKAINSLLARYRTEIIRTWESKDWVKTTIGPDGKFNYTILLIEDGETFEQFSPKLLELIKAVV